MNAWLKNTLWLVGFLAACACAVAVRLDMVHRQTDEWQMRPSAEPSLLRYDGHFYDRTGHQPHKDHGYHKNGRNFGGGIIFAPTAQGVPVTIQVHHLHGYYDYQLAS
ncbi:hypothetical protein [Nocardioides sp. Iso805N]|uniref:hypothetical protein n=1 Tax=Nocardioides sp. Iso805N TaxID=1283287 RepID=UPI00036F92A4|nr:hypothetical protein [Nocardioides sp. Iso805N]